MDNKITFKVKARTLNVAFLYQSQKYTWSELEKFFSSNTSLVLQFSCCFYLNL